MSKSKTGERVIELMSGILLSGSLDAIDRDGGW